MARKAFFIKSLPKFSKRSKFVLSTVILTIGLLIAYLLGPVSEAQTITILALLSFLLTLFCLREELQGIKWLIVVLLPVIFTIACGLFYFLLPARWLTRLIMLVLFAVGFYATLLAQNIFLVSSLRSIKLLHAARTIGFLLSVVSAFGLYAVLFSLHTYLPVVVGVVAIVSFALIVPIIWSVLLGDSLGKKELLFVGVLTLALTELGTFITFWPVSVTFAAIFLAGNFYTLVGVSQHWLENSLFRRVLWEFVWVAVILSVILFFTTSWGG